MTSLGKAIGNNMALRTGGYSSRLLTLLKFASEKQQKSEAPPFKTWPNAPTARLLTSPYLAVSTYFLGF